MVCFRRARDGDSLQHQAGKVAYMIEGLHLKGRPRAARVALKTPKLSRKPRTVAMIKNADTAKRLSLHAQVSSHTGILLWWCQLPGISVARVVQQLRTVCMGLTA